MPALRDRLNYEDMTYSKLINHAKEGDQNAFGELFRRTHVRLVRYVYYRTRSQDLAEEVAAQAYLLALKRINQLTDYREESSFVRWMSTICRNLIADHYKSHYYTRQIPVAEFLDSDFRDMPEVDVIETMFGYEVMDAVWAALPQLNDRQRLVFKLRCFDDLMYSEIGVIVGISEAAAKEIFRRVQKTLRRDRQLSQLWSELVSSRST